jgi:hypothetical protein
MIVQETLPEETDDFDDFRLHSAELIHDIVFVVGATDAFYQVRHATYCR